jgi:signal peptidase I
MDTINLRDNSSSDADNSPNGQTGFKKVFEFLWEIAKVVIISLAIIIPVRMFVIQPFIVEGASMVPNFHDGEYLVVDEISYRLTSLKRGDVVIFHPPSLPDVYYIKRIIGLPGETLEIKDDSIYITPVGSQKSFKLDESSYLSDAESNTGQNMKSVTLKNNEFFLMGDNRHNSLDSRRFGPVSMDHVRGRVLVRAYPFNQFTLFSAPSYNF